MTRRSRSVPPPRRVAGRMDVASSSAKFACAPTWMTEANLAVPLDAFMATEEQREKAARFRACRSLFERLDTTRKGLDEDQFVAFCREGIQDPKTEEQLRVMFMQIDSDTSGRVTWEEMSAMFLTYKDRYSEKYEFKAQAVFIDRDASVQDAPRDLRRGDSPILGDRHEDMVSSLQVRKSNYYYTASFDGAVKAWSCTDGSLLHTVQKSDVPIGAICLFDDHKHLAVATIDRQINIYQVVWYGHELVRRFIGTQLNDALPQREQQNARSPPAAGKAQSLPGMESRTSAVMMAQSKASKPNVPTMRMRDLVDAPTALQHVSLGGQSQLVVGLQTGGLQVYNVTKMPLTTNVTDISCVRKLNVHRELISQLVWCDQIGVVSSSWDCKICITDIEHGNVVRTLGESDGHTKSILSMDWSDDLKIIASAGCERDVYIWNPYIVHPVTKLQGHHAPVTSVAFNSEDMQLITMDWEKTLKVWDLRSNKVFQTIRDLSHYYPEDALTAMAYDPYRRCIVAAATYIKTWPLAQSVKGRKDARSASRVLPGVYNRAYNHVCSFERDTVNVWDVATGKKFFSFKARDEEWVDDRAEFALSGAQFDSSGRKLIVSFAGGDVLCFNYMNGEAVRKLEHVFPEEVTTFLHVERPEAAIKCILGSLNEEVVQWPDDGGFYQRHERKIVNRGGPVSAMAFVGPHHVAFGSATGVVVIRDLLHGVDEYELLPGVLPKKLFRWGHSEGVIQPKEVSLEFEDEGPEEDEEDEDLLTHVIGQKDPPTRVVESILFLPAKEVLATVMGEKYIHFWAVGSGVHTLCTFPVELYRKERLFCLATDAANCWFLAADDEGYVFVWDIQRMPRFPDHFHESHFKLHCQFKAHRSSILSLAYVEAGGFVVTSGSSSDIKLHSLNGWLIGEFADGHPGWELGTPATWERPSPLPDQRLSLTLGCMSPTSVSRDAVTFGDFLYRPPSSNSTLPALSSPNRGKRPAIMVHPPQQDDDFPNPSVSLPPIRAASSPQMRSRRPLSVEPEAALGSSRVLSTSSKTSARKAMQSSILKSRRQQCLPRASSPEDLEGVVPRSAAENVALHETISSTHSRPTQDIMTAVGGVHARKGAKSEWLGRIMSRWLEKEAGYEGSHPLFNVVKATLGVTQATTVAFGDDVRRRAQEEDEDEEVSISHDASFVDMPVPETSADAAASSVKDTTSPTETAQRPSGFIRQAVKEAKMADRQWADRAVSLLPLQQVSQPTPLQTTTWLHPELEVLRPAISHMEVDGRNSEVSTLSPRKTRSTRSGAR
eukprot:GGOE01017854.1.p1 GENE.GGOE01017854.1~~GGOE01017854.1.p1  ORF type:complete len:1283 (-),score=425.70 GGOE01017854.1:553-4401(-)